MKVQKYCLGFAFDRNRTHVLLIRKERPDWAKGLLNGLGGKFKNHAEHPAEAMTREFREECGLTVAKWRQFALMTGGGSEVHIFETATARLSQARQLTDEEPLILPVAICKSSMLVPSVTWLIPLACDTTKHAYIQSSHE